MQSATSPAATAAGAEEEAQPKNRNRHEDEAKRLEYLLFGGHSCSEPETEPPSSSSSSSGADDDPDYDPEDFTEEGLRARDALLSVSKSVVSLSASTDGDPPSTFSCTGTVVAHEGSSAWVLTSATLIRKRGSDTEVHGASDVEIEVLLHNKKVVKGQLLMYDLQYNVAVVSIEEGGDLPAVTLNDLPESYFLTPRRVVAICREFEPQRLRMKHGQMIREISKLDCDELMVSTCQIKQSFIGGLLMDLEKRIVGMTFMDDDTTPFLPIEIVGRCVRHFQKFGEIKQPWLGIRGRALLSLESAKLEKICLKYPEPPFGILVNMIPEASRANCGGIEVGDILSQLDGVVLHTAAQLTALLLDKMEVAMHIQKPVVVKALIQRPRDCTTFVANLIVVERPPGECDVLFKNRWILRQPGDLYWWGPPDPIDFSD